MSITRISSRLLDNLVERAKRSIRLRYHYNFHVNYSDAIQQLTNSIGIDSYIRPHRHALDPKLEILLALKGSFALVIFDEEGLIAEVIKFGSERYINKASNYGVNIPSGIWHTVIALVSESVLFEVKSGPFDPLTAKELAPWAPAEGSYEAIFYLKNIRESIGRM